LFAVVVFSGLFLSVVMPVFAQEAYYWTYAQHLDLAYFDHPPMVAWLIWSSTSILGDGALGIRAGIFACGSAATLIGFLLVRSMSRDRSVHRAWMVVSLAVPLLLFSRFFANPDSPLLFGWSVALFALWRARKHGALGWWLLAGAGAGFALLAKYTAAFLAVGGVLLLLFDPAFRRQWRKAGPWVGVVTAAIVFSPVVIWNVGNDFESFRFQTEGRWSKSEFGLKWFGSFIGSQFAVYHPVLLLLLVPVLPWMIRRLRDGDARMGFLLAFALPMPIFFLVNSFFIQVKMNWLMPAFVPLLIGTLLWRSESGIELRWPRLCRSLRIAIGATPALIALAPLAHVWPQGGGSSWSGWEEIGKRALAIAKKVEREDAIADNVFFFASGYRDSAQLGRTTLLAKCVAGDEGTLPPILAQNVIGERALQFDHWESPAAHIGHSAVYVLPRADARPNEIEKVRSVFDSIEKIERFELTTFGIRQMYADIFICRGYRGPPRQSE
jgi:dolichol-phosphate mannosyltransferase